MHHLTLAFSSAALGQRVSLTALLPERRDGPFATLYLLHGLSDDHTIWTRLTSLERYAWELPLAIVMPQGFRGFYTANAEGPDYDRYLVEDVIGTCERLLPLRRDRAGRAIGGNSMGGYGAMRMALSHPDRFVSAHATSGAFLYPTQGVASQSSLLKVEARRIFGETPTGSVHDLEALAARVSDPPALWIDCGVDDFLIGHNRAFHATLDRVGVAHEYAEHAGAHTWDYWDARLPATLAFHACALGLTADA